MASFLVSRRRSCLLSKAFSRPSSSFSCFISSAADLGNIHQSLAVLPWQFFSSGTGSLLHPHCRLAEVTHFHFTSSLRHSTAARALLLQLLSGIFLNDMFYACLGCVPPEHKFSCRIMSSFFMSCISFMSVVYCLSRCGPRYSEQNCATAVKCLI